MHSIVRAVAAAGGAAVLLTALTSLARAADGQFSYSRSDTGAASTLSTPSDDVCLPLGGGAAHAANDTDATAFVYADGGCKQLLAVVGVGSTWDQTGPPPAPARSVRFGSG
ncbi:hypothetical protein AB0D14_45015 [Streptomyces sp. NPDC048484]|uniref:hypothetical protein n=1 Tax=Streptomyces sp. NPDC048484 TaxID=3155146 RepID=UPI00341E5F93